MDFRVERGRDKTRPPGLWFFRCPAFKVGEVGISLLTVGHWSLMLGLPSFQSLVFTLLVRCLRMAMGVGMHLDVTRDAQSLKVRWVEA